MLKRGFFSDCTSSKLSKEFHIPGGPERKVRDHNYVLKNVELEGTTIWNANMILSAVTVVKFEK